MNYNELFRVLNDKILIEQKQINMNKIVPLTIQYALRIGNRDVLPLLYVTCRSQI